MYLQVQPHGTDTLARGLSLCTKSVKTMYVCGGVLPCAGGRVWLVWMFHVSRQVLKKYTVYHHILYQKFFCDGWDGSSLYSIMHQSLVDSKNSLDHISGPYHITLSHRTLYLLLLQYSLSPNRDDVVSKCTSAECSCSMEEYLITDIQCSMSGHEYEPFLSASVQGEYKIQT